MTHAECIPAIDGFVAAVVLHHHLTVAICGGVDVAVTSVNRLNPWKD